MRGEPEMVSERVSPERNLAIEVTTSRPHRSQAQLLKGIQR
jgi:hypothetical protein